MILVTGATGFIGRAVVTELLRTGHRVRCLVRNPDRAKDLAAAGCELVVGDVLDAASVRSAATGVRAIYHLTHTMTGQTATGSFAELDLQAVRNVRATGVDRVLYVSILGVDAGAADQLGRARWAVEEELRQVGHPTVVRVGTVIGRGGYGFETLAGAVSRSPVVILPGGREHRDQPIGLADLVRLLALALDDERTYGRTFEEGTPAALTYGEMADGIAAVLNKRRVTVGVPGWLLRPLAPFVERAQRMPPGTFAAVLEGLGKDMVCRPGSPSLHETLGVSVADFRQAVEAVLRA